MPVYNGANKRLSNLVTTAINASLISDADNTHDLGSSTYWWRTLYSRGISLKGTSATDLPTYSAELLLDTGWTSTDWTGDFASGWTHTTGNTTVLSQSKTAVNATKYQIAYTITNRTTGTFTIGFGGQTSDAIAVTGAWGPTSSSTASLTITPTSDFNGEIVISIKSITGVSNAICSFLNSSGTIVNEIRTSNSNTNNFMGFGSGRYNTTGSYNCAQGGAALYSNTTGPYNCAQGYAALSLNTTGRYNCAQGYAALSSNTTGSYNCAQGGAALYSNTTGSYNCAQGVNALYSNTTGPYNCAQGVNALSSNTTGPYNCAQGGAALSSNTTGSYNCAQGYAALYSNTTGSYNCAQGYAAGRYISGGVTVNTICNNSVFLGSLTKAYADDETNEIVVGYNATGAGSNTATIGNASIAQILFSQGSLGKWNANYINLPTAKTPASAAAAGTTGDICWDANYIYVCTATNTWERSAIATW